MVYGCIYNGVTDVAWALTSNEAFAATPIATATACTFLPNTDVSFARTSSALARMNVIAAHDPAATIMANNYLDLPLSSSIVGPDTVWDTGHPFPNIKITLDAAPRGQTPVGSAGGGASTASGTPGNPSGLATLTTGEFSSPPTSLPESTSTLDFGPSTTLWTIAKPSTPPMLTISTGTTPSSTLTGTPWTPGEASIYGALEDLRSGKPPLFIAIMGIAVLWALFFAWAVWSLWQDDEKNTGRRCDAHCRGPMELDVLRSLKKPKDVGYQADTN